MNPSKKTDRGLIGYGRQIILFMFAYSTMFTFIRNDWQLWLNINSDIQDLMSFIHGQWFLMILCGTLILCAGYIMQAINEKEK